MTKHKLVVIGAGPGGYVAAIRAAQLGMDVAIIEANHLGGICLNWGCIPTKALLKSSEVYHYLERAADYGLKAEKISFDMEKIVERSRNVANQLSGGIRTLLKKNKIKLYEAYGKLKGNGKIELSVDGKVTEIIQAEHIIIATGARARQLSGLEADRKLIWNYKEALVAKDLPKRLLVVGSGAIGVEFASFFAMFGSEVTIVEIQKSILPVEDKEISDLARKQFEKRGIKIRTETNVAKLDKKANTVVATFKDTKGESTEEFDRVIVAVGIIGNTEDIGLENTKVKVDRGFIVNGKFLETDEKNVYAIGDVASAPWLAHKASHEAIICVEKIAGLPHVKPLKVENIPGCTYSYPQIASVGYTEAKAKELGYELKIGRFPFMANGKAIALGETNGLIKTIFDRKTGELLGAHMIGAEVTELIQGFVIAKTAELTEADLMHTIFAHPTLSEMMHESVLDAYGQVIHM